MSQDAATDEPFTWPPAFDHLIRGNQAWLAERGETIIGSGHFRSGQLSGSVHTDFGPEDQDKDANQDYAMAWLPHDAKIRKRFRLILALGDGLTTSFRSEWASALVCSVALRALVEGALDVEPRDLARYAFNEAGRSLGRLADELTREPEASCPPGQFVSTWKYILRKGVLFQSTLTLAWLDRDFLRIAMVGDGGATWRGYHAPSPGQRAADRVLAECDLDRHQVCALGPADRNVREFDCWHEEKLNGPFLCALHTDGVGRGLGGNSRVLLDELEKLQAAGVENTARRFIEQAVEERPQDFDDNLTLAVIRTE
ncbi:MAG: protein phosphatase 2C domain-containing protein [Phycisphaerae bacterium]|nr:protein phosphatase 2C domain-containing protein [Phycisphaerae bacterium]